MRWVFEHPTVGRLAGALEGAEPVRGEQAGGIPRREGRGPCGLSFSQQRLWFLDQLEPESTLYNIHDAMPWNGRLDRGALERALGEVVRRHEVLRTTFTAVDGVAMQVVGPAGEMRLEVVDLSGLGEEERAEEAARVGEEDALLPFDLERGPLLRAHAGSREEEPITVTMAIRAMGGRWGAASGNKQRGLRAAEIAAGGAADTVHGFAVRQRNGAGENWSGNGRGRRPSCPGIRWTRGRPRVARARQRLDAPGEGRHWTLPAQTSETVQGDAGAWNYAERTGRRHSDRCLAGRTRAELENRPVSSWWR